MKQINKKLGFLLGRFLCLPLLFLLTSISNNHSEPLPAHAEITSISNNHSEPLPAPAENHNHGSMTAWTSNNSLPSNAGSYYLTTDVALTTTWYFPDNGAVTLCLNGHGIRGNGSKMLIYAGQNKTGTILDCNSTNLEHKFKVNSPRSNGAGIATVNDSLTSDYKTFKGGYLTNGRGDGSSTTGGSVMYVRGTVNFYGGTIIGNNCDQSDGRGTIRIHSSTGGRGIFNMYGGAISYNYAKRGGAICLDQNGQASEFNMYGGEISYNVANDGGAIHANSKTVINSGSIHDNVSNNYGIVVNNTFNFGGDTYIYNNLGQNDENRDIYLNNNVMNITKAINKKAKHLKTAVALSSTTGKIAKNWENYMPNDYAPYYFKSINPDYTIGLDGNDVAIGNYHVHEWVYTANDNVITASCGASGCDLEDQTLTISASDKAYDGTPVEASVSASSGWLGRNGLEDIPAITYSGNTEIGSYTASITINDQTASVPFVIKNPHNHELVFSAEGNVLSVYCSTGVCDLGTQTLTITAEDKVYDGEPVVATVTPSDGWNKSNDLPDIPEIVYSGNTNVGTYTASITIGNVTASCEFSITPVTDSDVDIIGGDTGDVVVNGLDEEIDALIEQNPTANSISLSMQVESKTQDTAESGEEIAQAFDNKIFQFFDVKLEKTIDSETTSITETSSVIEIGLSYQKINKRDISVYSYHDNAIRTFVESDTKADGTFRLDKANFMVYVYTKTFSTYAISYTPYYKLSIDLSFATYDGKVNVSLQNKQGETIYKLEDVDASNIVFQDVAMGEYIAVVTWNEGQANNSLSFKLTLGPSGAVITPIANG